MAKPIRRCADCVCALQSSRSAAAHESLTYRISHGYSAASMAARMEAFRKGLHDLGYVEGKNLVIDYRYADGKTDSLSTFAAELVRAKIEVIVTAGASATGPAKEATTTIPIIMAQDSIFRFNNVLLYVLLGAGFTNMMFGYWTDAANILAVVIVAAGALCS